MKAAAITGVFMILISLFGWFCFCEGQVDVRRSTVVRTGSPYYEGIFYGTCAWIGTVEACAADGRKDSHGYPLNPYARR